MFPLPIIPTISWLSSLPPNNFGIVLDVKRIKIIQADTSITPIATEGPLKYDSETAVFKMTNSNNNLSSMFLFVVVANAIVIHIFMIPNPSLYSCLSMTLSSSSSTFTTLPHICTCRQKIICRVHTLLNVPIYSLSSYYYYYYYFQFFFNLLWVLINSNIFPFRFLVTCIICATVNYLPHLVLLHVQSKNQDRKSAFLKMKKGCCQGGGTPSCGLFKPPTEGPDGLMASRLLCTSTTNCSTMQVH